MTLESARTPEGDAATDVVLALFRAHGLVLTVGHQLASQEGLTSARWQVLGAVALAGQPLTVPQIARRMGLTRQAVQVTVNHLLGDELVEANDNLAHARSPLIGLTEPGRQKYAVMDRRQIAWINELAAGLKLSDLAAAARLLNELADRLEATALTGPGRNDADDAP